jgi:leader peptidase (prepilin peptidase) / N-methyltransferase
VVNAALVAGCGAGGVVIGGVLDALTGRIVRPPETLDPDESAPLAPAASSGGPIAAPSVVALRSPGVGELTASGLVTGLAFALLAVRVGAVPVLAAYCALLGGLLAASVVDIRIGTLPRSILYPTFAVMAVGLLAASAVDSRWRALGEAGIGGVGAFVVFFALWWFFPRGLGYGDVRLAGVMGTALGWIGFGELYVGFLAAFALGALVGVGLMLSQGTGRKTRLPFGPPLALGAALGILWGPWAVHLWSQHHG